MASVTKPFQVGWRRLNDDVSYNFQLNRWLALGGERWLADVEPILPSLTGYDAWRDGFCKLGDAAESEGRLFDAGLHLRAAEFFMMQDDPRKKAARERFRRHFQGVFRGRYEALEVPFGAIRLPAVRFGRRQLRDAGGTDPGRRGTVVMFSGFDGYLEELFPILATMGERGHDIVAFEGPGQGAVLEDQRVPMTADWHLPVGAVLDALGLDDVTLIGLSLGGCLVIRAAAFEPRVRRVVAFDVLSDFQECMIRQAPEAARPVLRGLLATHAGLLMDGLLRVAAHHRPVIEWGLAQAMHVFGQGTPYDAWQAAKAFRTDDVSSRVKQDVLLLAGADDHYVPLEQLWTQARALTRARSLTLRVFTQEEQAQAHCQVGNLPLALDVISRWMDGP